MHFILGLYTFEESLDIIRRPQNLKKIKWKIYKDSGLLAISKLYLYDCPLNLAFDFLPNFNTNILYLIEPQVF